MEWYDDETFWIDVYPFMFPESRMERAEEDTEELVELTCIRNGRVLDLCCGPGRFSAAFARRGFEVTGVDVTTCLLNMAKQRAAVENMDIEWVLCDMREFVREEYYDLVLSMFTSFGYFQEHEQNMKVLRNMRDSLRSDGKAVIDVMGKEILASIFRRVSVEEHEDGSILVQKHVIRDGWRMIGNDWLLLDDSGLRGRWKFSHWIYSAAELEAMLLEAGFFRVDVYGTICGTPYDDTARRLIAVAMTD